MENILVRKIEEKDIAKTAKVFAEAFNYMDNEKGWTTKTATLWINYWLKRMPEMFLIAEKEGEVIGGVAGDIKPYKETITLTEIVLFVSPDYHKQGAAKKLLKKLVEESVDKYGVSTVDAIADSNRIFPMGWYNKIGLQKTDWVYIEGNAKEILKNLEK